MESLAFFLFFSGGASGKKLIYQCRRCKRCGLIPKLGRSPGEGNGNPLQCSCLENPMNRRAWRAAIRGVTKSQTWLSMHAFFIHPYPVLPTNSFKTKKLFLNFLNTCYAMEDKVFDYIKRTKILSWASILMGNKTPSLLLIVLSFLRTINKRLFTWTTLVTGIVETIHMIL